jgi:hypothetical protein
MIKAKYVVRILTICNLYAGAAFAADMAFLTSCPPVSALKFGKSNDVSAKITVSNDNGNSKTVSWYNTAPLSDITDNLPDPARFSSATSIIIKVEGNSRTTVECSYKQAGSFSDGTKERVFTLSATTSKYKVIRPNDLIDWKEGSASTTKRVFNCTNTSNFCPIDIVF